MPETDPPRSRIWSRPPFLKTWGRFGFAHSRSLERLTDGLATSLAGAEAFGCSLGAEATWRPADAACVGAASFFGSLSSLATEARETLTGFGVGYSLAS